jgi:hypothetical protein
MKRSILLTLGAGAGLCSIAATLASCDEATKATENLCGPCGSIATGNLSIAGDARLDGFFKATADLRDATASIRADFDQDILAIAAVYGMTTTEVNAEFVAELRAAIEADIAANTDGGLQVVLEPARCQADVAVSVEAQASCEAQAGCDVEVDPGMVAVSCEGTCRGECSGECSGELACAVRTPTAGCEGQCEGSCQLEGSAQCDGTCRGECSGECAATNADGECAGRCDGSCSGVCEIEGRAECQGTCQGTCFVDPGSAQCSGEVECAGTCNAECRGSCEGDFEPPSASADCEASADCKAQARAQAQANVECTPPQLIVDFAFAADLDAEARAAFVARMKTFQVRAVALLQGVARLQALVTGEVDGEVVFDPAPLVAVRGQLEGVIEAGVEGDFDIAPGRLACVIPAFRDAVQALVDVGGDAQVTLSAGAELSGLLGGG